MTRLCFIPVLLLLLSCADQPVDKKHEATPSSGGQDSLITEQHQYKLLIGDFKVQPTEVDLYEISIKENGEVGILHTFSEKAYYNVYIGKALMKDSSSMTIVIDRCVDLESCLSLRRDKDKLFFNVQDIRSCFNGIETKIILAEGDTISFYLDSLESILTKPPESQPYHDYVIKDMTPYLDRIRKDSYGLPSIDVQFDLSQFGMDRTVAIENLHFQQSGICVGSYQYMDSIHLIVQEQSLEWIEHYFRGEAERPNPSL